MHVWLRTYDLNLPLLDAINDPQVGHVRARLAALSLSEEPDSGYYDAAALADILTELWYEESEAQAGATSEARFGLATILQSEGGTYMCALYAAVRNEEPWTAAGHLIWLARVMGPRADMVRIREEAQMEARPAPTW